MYRQVPTCSKKGVNFVEKVHKSPKSSTKVPKSPAHPDFAPPCSLLISPQLELKGGAKKTKEESNMGSRIEDTYEKEGMMILDEAG